MIDVVIPAHPKDFRVLRHSVAAVLRHVTPLRRVLVVSPEPFSWPDDRVAWIAEPAEGPLPTLGEVRRRLATRGPELAERAGWVYQQLLKLGVPGYVDDVSASYLVVDADVIFLRPVSFDPDIHGRLPYSKAIENHTPYRDSFTRLFGEAPPVGFSLTVHHMLYDRELLAAMAEELQARHGTTWALAYIDAVDAAEPSSISEMDVYGWWVLSRRPEAAHLRQLAWRDVRAVPTAVGRAAMSLDHDFAAAHAWMRRSRWRRGAIVSKRLAAEVRADLARQCRR